MGLRHGSSSSLVMVLRNSLALRLGVSSSLALRLGVSSSSNSRRSTRLRLGRALLLRLGCCRLLQRIRLGSHWLLLRGSNLVLDRGNLGNNHRRLLHGSRSIRLGSSPSMGRGSSPRMGRGSSSRVLPWSRPLLLLSGGNRWRPTAPPLVSILLLCWSQSMLLLLPGSSHSMFLPGSSRSIPLLGSLPGLAPLPGAGSFLQGLLF